MPAIRVSGLVKRFKAQTAVDGISFEVPRGQVCALLGPNGAGKTTTIQCMLGLTLPTEGSIEVLGHDVVADRTTAISRTNFAASYTSFPWRLRVREVLRVYAGLYDVEDHEAAIARVVELFGLEDMSSQPVQSLSSGQQTLINLAKALINQPELLILDEPTASLDPENAFHARGIIQQTAAETGMTVFITSHNMPEIEKIADRVLFISEGRIVADASPSDLRDQFKAGDLEEVFLAVARESRR
ncbi:MAG: ABC transporter ATP-binding protein [Acidimicrobiia bacterium]|nr:ABC transporter ATP-binding protein [Acidimicrobiia bacterium]